MLVPPSRRRKAERLFAEGGIQPRWVGLPSADEIRQLDRDRMLLDESAFQDLSEFDWEMASAFLSKRSPKACSVPPSVKAPPRQSTAKRPLSCTLRGRMRPKLARP